MIGMKLIELESVGSVIDPDTLEIYPLFENGALDFGNTVSLYDVTDEWFESLSSYDVSLLIEAGIYDVISNE